MSRRLYSTLSSHRRCAKADPKTLERAARKRSEWADKLARGLGEDGDGNSIILDTTKKTVATSVGELPISPIMDPEFLEARQRWRTPKEKARKAPPTDLKGRAKAKLRANAFAQALATPLRQCPITSSLLPSFFHQKLKLVLKSGTNNAWIVPEDIVMPSWQDNAVEEAAPEGNHGDGQESLQIPPESAPDKAQPAAPESPYKKPMTSPTVYILARKQLLDNLSKPRSTAAYADSVARLLSRRDRLTAFSKARPVWRADMGDFVLENLRRNVVNTILYYIKLSEEDGRAYLRPCDSWEGVARMQKRGCLLWLPSNAGVSGTAASTDSSLDQFATYEVPGVKWEKALPVHDIEFLLGPQNMAVLRRHTLFRDHSLLLVGKDRSVALQLYLWKLQGYLAEYPGDDVSPLRRPTEAASKTQ